MIAWSTSIASRSTSVAISLLSPLLLDLRDASIFLTMYATFLLVQNLFASVSESQQLRALSAHERQFRPSGALVPAAITSIAAISLGTAISHLAGIIFLVSCAFAWVWAELRTGEILAGKILRPYSSTVSRDLAAIAVLIIFGGQPYIAIVVAAAAMMATLIRGEPRRPLRLNHPNIWMGQSLILALPFGQRIFAIDALSPTEIIAFDQAIRLGSVFLGLILAGVGTELQLRMMACDIVQIRRLTLRSIVVVLLLTSTAALAILGAISVGWENSHLALTESSAFGLAVFGIAGAYALLQRAAHALGLERHFVRSSILSTLVGLGASVELIDSGAIGLLTAFASGQLVGSIMLVSRIWDSTQQKPEEI